MIPKTENPTLNILMDTDGKPAATSTNIDPEVKVNIFTDRGDFEEASKGMPFDSTRPPQEQQVLSSAASAARHAKAAASAKK